MEKEQEKKQNHMQEIAAIISEKEHLEGNVRIFMEEIKRYAAICGEPHRQLCQRVQSQVVLTDFRETE